MNLRSRLALLVLSCGIAMFTRMAGAEDFAGKYEGRNLTVNLTSTGGDGYSGTIQMGSRQFPLTAHVRGAQLQGTFESNGATFPFNATLAGDSLSLVSGGAIYEMTRPSAPANPLAAPPTADNPLSAPNQANAAQPGDSDYVVLASTASGKTIFFQQPAAKSAQAALQATLPEVAKVIGAGPVVGGAFADQKEQSRGGASFTAKVGGNDVRGMMLCGGRTGGGEIVTIVFARADAPAAEWSVLTAALPSDGKTTTYNFPDGTGSIDLPERWTTQAQSAIGGVHVKGPADQTVTIGVGISVVTPNSMAVRMQRQLEMQARQMGSPPPPPMRLFVAPFTGPVDAIKNLVPQISQFAQQAGLPPVELVKILEVKEVQANLPTGHAALMGYLIDKGEGASIVRYKAVAQVETYPLGDGTDSWGVFTSELAAPESHFDSDIATMSAIARSCKTNDAVIAAKTQQAIQQSNQRFAAYQQSVKEKSEAFDRYIESQNRNQTIRERCNADFDEVIRGYRTVEDTTTGERTSVDLGNVTKVVEKLNEVDPGRYKEIPLRDETHPLPDAGK